MQGVMLISLLEHCLLAMRARARHWLPDEQRPRMQKVFQVRQRSLVHDALPAFA